jgi:hypothetical protein
MDKQETKRMAETDTKLRDEILAFQAGQRDLMRWKLITIGGLAGVALGISTASTNSTGMVICLAPLVSVYCDLLCREYDLRIAIIAAFLRKPGRPFAEYERFIDSVGSTRWWRLKKTTLYGPTAAACVLTAVIGYLVAIRQTPVNSLTRNAALVAAAIGSLLLILVERWFNSKQQGIRQSESSGEGF